MQTAIIGTLLVILFFSIRGIISLFLIIWGGKKIKEFWKKRKLAKEVDASENEDGF